MINENYIRVMISLKYIYEKKQENYGDFASGRVMYNQEGAAAFPVRLASEIFLRSKDYLERKGVKEPFIIYDPCCGGAYLLTTLGFLHGKCFSKIIGSDVDEGVLGLARRNLALLSLDGIEKRIRELENDIRKYNKESHKEALKSALTLKGILEEKDYSFSVECFQADALADRLPGIDVDLIMTDLPYGNLTTWSGAYDNDDNSLGLFLDNMLDLLKPTSILTIISEKSQKIEHKGYNRIKHFTTGKRRISFLEKRMCPP